MSLFLFWCKFAPHAADGGTNLTHAHARITRFHLLPHLHITTQSIILSAREPNANNTATPQGSPDTITSSLFLGGVF